MEFKEYNLIECVSEIIDYRGKTPKKLGGEWDDNGDYRAISAKNIKNNKIVNEEAMKKVNKEIYMKWMKKEVKKGDILLTSEAPLGETYYWDSEEKIVLSQRIYGIRANENIIKSRYLFAYMQSRNFSHELTSRESGTTVTGIRQSELEKVKIKIPVLSIQKYIGDTIFNLNQKIQVNSEIINTLEKISQTLFKHWFIDFEFPNEEGKPYKSSGGEMEESELGEIPKAWEIYNVNEFAKSISNSINKKEKQYAKFLNTSDVLDGEIADVDFLPTKNMPGQAKKLIEQNDILYSEIRPKNKRYAYIQIENADDYVVSTKLMVLRTNEEILSSKLFYIWLTMQSTINELNQIAESRSGTFPQITFSILSKFKLALPPKNLMDALTATVTPLLNEIYELRSENKKLVELRDILLPKLLSGEIEIPDDLEV